MIVCPSGAARTSASSAINPPAPVRFSTMKEAPGIASARISAATRARLSVFPPGAKGTRIRTGRSGQACARATPAAATPIAASAALRPKPMPASVCAPRS
jgi:hypothetical protein